MIESIILTDEKKCVGCNKCIMVCPIKYVNNVKIVNGERKIEVDKKRCIICGRCIQICDHNARSYSDDSEAFWEDLKKGKKITVITAPSFVTNQYKKYKHFFGYLKSLGVNFIYDTSIGADITIWAYTKYIKENKKNADFLISQPCSSIVNYIEKYAPNLVKNLIPIQSPSINLAIYLKRQLGNTDKIAFISPCIAKKTEFNKTYTQNLINYNVPFEQICKYIKENGIDISDYPEVDFDNIDAGLGVLFSKPGGLKEGLLYHLPDLKIKQIEGTEKTYEYLNFLNDGNKPGHIDFIDVLSCQKGCNVGTASCRDCHYSDLSTTLQNELLNDRRLQAQEKRVIDFEEYKKLFQNFDETLELKDFIVEYISESHKMDIIEPTEKELDEAFNLLEKRDPDSRKINCYSCGYKNCKDMAIAIHNGYNIPASCYQYNIKELETQKKLLEESEEYVRMVLEHVSDHILVTDETDIIQLY